MKKKAKQGPPPEVEAMFALGHKEVLVKGKLWVATDKQDDPAVVSETEKDGDSVG